ncbi:MAG: carbohydrate-binding protein [Bacteroidota bacterium]
MKPTDYTVGELCPFLYKGARFLFFLCLLNYPFLQLNAQSPIIEGELRKWHKVTLTFDGPSTSETATPNPFSDYSLNVTFTKGSKTYVVPGYFAACGDAAENSCTSGDKWRVHFAPDEEGAWNYSVSFKQGNDVAINGGGSSVSGLDGFSGSLNIATSNKTGIDNRAKGRLQYVGEHYLQIPETGEWFFKVGADAPENTLAYEDFDDVPNKSGRRKSWAPHQQDYDPSDASEFTWQSGKGTEILGMVKYLSDQGMNVFSFLTFSLSGDDKNIFPHLLKVSVSEYNGLSNDAQWNSGVHKDRFDVSRMDQWEKLFEYSDKKGMYLHIKTQETENDQRMDGGNVGRERKLYYRELIARYSHHLALNWNTGEENSQTGAQEVAMAEFLAFIDPYNHNRVMHTYPGQKDRYNNLTGSQSEYTGASLQSGINQVHNDTRTWVQNSRNAGKKWVVANDEQGSAQSGVNVDADYPDNQLPENRGQSDNREAVRRQVLWGNMLAGGAGVEYYYGYQTGCDDLDCQDHRTRESKWADARVAKDFFNTYLQSFATAMVNNDGLTTDNQDYVFQKEEEIYVIYRPSGGSIAINLPTGNDNYQLQWFDPITGNMQNPTSIGTNLVAPNNNQDWVALVQNNSIINEPTAPQVLFIRGGEGSGGFFEGGSDEQLADINNFQTFGGNHGWGELAALLESEGYELTQVIEGPGGDSPVELENMDLDQYDVIVFGSNNATYGEAAVDSVIGYLKNGGSALFISDANFGADWNDASNSDNNFLSEIGWEMNQDRGTYNLTDFLDPGHPILENVSIFGGEGVTPITVVDSTIAGVNTSILVRVPTNQNVGRLTIGTNRGPSTASTPQDAVLVIAEVEQGRVAGHFDRNTFFNLNGAGGRDLNKLDHITYAINLFNWLAGIDTTSNQSPANESPTVSIQKPVDGAEFLTGDDVNIEVEASDNDGTIELVLFFDGQTLIAQDSITPYSFTIENVDVGSFTIRVVATDNDGSSSEAEVSFTVVEPFVTFTIPGLVEAEDANTLSGSVRAENTPGPIDQNLGFIRNGDFVEYEIGVNQAGNYQVDFSVSSRGSGGDIDLVIDGAEIGSVSVPVNGEWHEYSIQSTTVFLDSGIQTLKLDFVGPNGFLYNIDNFTFTEELGEIVVTDINLLNCPDSLILGEMVDLDVEIIPANATNQTLAFTTSTGIGIDFLSGEFTAELVGEITIFVTSFSDGAVFDQCSIIILDSIAPNLPPIANAGPDQFVVDQDRNGNELVTLDGSASFDLDGSIQSFRWTLNDNEIASGATPTLSLTSGVNIITLEVTDDMGSTATDQVEITVDEIRVTDLNFINCPTEPLFISETIDLDVEILPANATNQTLAFTTSTGTGIDFLDGEFTAEVAGEITINVTSFSDGSVSEQCIITILDPTDTIPSQETSFFLVDAGADVTIRALVESDVIDKSINPSSLSIIYDPGVAVASVRFQLSGAVSKVQIENVLPYALNGDINGDYKPFDLPLGSYTLVISAHDAPQAGGNVILRDTIEFEVVENSGSASTRTSSLGIDAANSLQSLSEITLYPNPARDHFKLSNIETDDFQQVLIYNEIGIMVKSVELTSSDREIDIRELDSGLYFVRLGSSKNTLRFFKE